MSQVVPATELERATAALRAGLIVGIPTDTVYGLAADPGRGGATAALFAAKGRPASLELPVLVADAAQADTLADDDGLPPLARRLVGRFWPGALTVVVGRWPGLAWELGGDGDTIGLRCPALDTARTLCREVGPLATTSANRHGEPPLVTAEAVAAAFPGIVVVDGGRCDGEPSTVVDGRGPEVRLVRAGAVAWSEIEALLSDRR